MAAATTTAATGAFTPFPIGVAGQKWAQAELAQWRAEYGTKKRCYFADVVAPLMRVPADVATVFEYGRLDYRSLGSSQFPLFAAKSAAWSATKPMVLVTGGVHGYETSGVHGALRFVAEKLGGYSDKLNVLVLPCVSPWGYETINRWTPLAVDPNRQFNPAAPGCEEAAHAMKCALAHAAESTGLVFHMDMHETTDTDNSEFRPAKSARDGEPLPEWSEIPDGFYLIGDKARPELAWHQYVLAAVEKVTHVAEADANGMLAGEPAEDLAARGILICDPVGDCASFSTAKYSVTTEVYPDSNRTNPEECTVAQVTAASAGLDYVLKTEGY